MVFVAGMNVAGRTNVLHCSGASPSAMTAGNRSLARSEEHTSELQSQFHLVCRLPLEKKKLSSKKIDRVLLVGPEFAKAHQAVGGDALLFTNVFDLKAWFEREQPVGYTVLLKGSRGMELEKLLEK